MRIRLFVLCVQVSQLKATAYTVQTRLYTYFTRVKPAKSDMNEKCRVKSRSEQLQINATILASDIKAI